MASFRTNGKIGIMEVGLQVIFILALLADSL